MLGIIEAPGSRPDAAAFDRALALLRHRGPDGHAVVAIDDRTTFGHTRLSIIDLSHGSDQPMGLEGRWWLTYNGELFNYRELRAELEAEGCRFTSSGDVEVVLRALVHWGPAAATRRFNGMWAFALYDARERTLFCSRDRFGIKPFNYHAQAGRFLFASEIKALLALDASLAEPDYTAIANYCRASVGAQHERTWFRRVKRLQPGCNLTVTADGAMRIERYWDYPPPQQPAPDEAQAARRYRELFDRAVALRMRSDVPLGITLSSGLDSTSIACVMQQHDPSPHHSFTASFRADELPRLDSAYYTAHAARPDTVDEAVAARKIAAQLGLQSHVVETDYGRFLEDLTRIVWHLEGGNISHSVVPVMQLYGRAREHVKVALDGQGADELLGGYVNSMLWPTIKDDLRRGRLRRAARSLRVFARTYTLRSALVMGARHATNDWPWLSRLHQRMSGLAHIYGPRLRDQPHMRDYPPGEAVPGEGPIGRALRQLHSGSLVDLLHYGDALSMANGMEARMPFLDFDLVDYVWSLPHELKARDGMGKVLHRQALRGLVPDEILDDPVKFGFNTPIAAFFRQCGAAAQACIDLLLDPRTLARGIFEKRGLQRVIEDHRAGRHDHGPLLYRLVSTELWFRNFIDTAAQAAHGAPPAPPAPPDAPRPLSPAASPAGRSATRPTPARRPAAASNRH